MKMKKLIKFKAHIVIMLCLLVLVACGGGSGSDNGGTELVADNSDSDYLPAFPGAEGFGAKSIGGRGGIVIKVINLDDYGTGSFRAAVEATPRHYAGSLREWESLSEYETRRALGNTKIRHYPAGTWKNENDEQYLNRLDEEGHRIVVFEVSGIINLESDLNITYPYMTIAGETSPGGVLVTGRQTTITSHDIIMRHMRFRVGSHRIADGADPETLDSLDIWGESWSGYDGAYNIIIDHCSTSWGVDETFTISGGVRDTTVQWSIVSEGLSHAGHPKGEHSKGLLVGGKYAGPSTVSLHHNYIAHNTARNPLITSAHVGEVIYDMTVDLVNNVSYNWKGGLSPEVGEVAKTNFNNNYMKQGGNSNSYSFELQHSNRFNTPRPLIYVYNNIGSTRLSQSDPQWNVGVDWHNELLNTAFQQRTPWPVPTITTTEMSYSYALEILQDVGATKPFRDSVDERVVADFAAGTGAIIDNVSYPGDFPVFQNLAVPTDNDNDGMADDWENSLGLDNSVDDSALDHDGDGYTNIEEYLHHLAN
ncbi:MAG: hypothetical protein L3J28_13790 [Candidatus Polarisedimenticolaceae bacterium]|nr:hypothetical protein [Candidatus Polarisedimenticolaceae bacterium]